MQLTIVYLLSLLSILQTPAAYSLVIFNPNRNYSYQAFFVSPSGDTLTREQITLQPNGQPWKY
ncbi:hypothetical protein ACFSRY_05645, partial [Pontibacter locisalis]